MLSLSVAFAVATLTAGVFTTGLVEADWAVVVLDDCCDDVAVLVSPDVDEFLALSTFPATVEAGAFDALEVFDDAVCVVAATFADTVLLVATTVAADADLAVVVAEVVFAFVALMGAALVLTALAVFALLAVAFFATGVFFEGLEDVSEFLVSSDCLV
jgi:hypothetical protein